jgi:hypothetical protein
VTGSSEHSAELSGSKNGDKFLDWISNNLKKHPASGSSKFTTGTSYAAP